MISNKYWLVGITWGGSLLACGVAAVAPVAPAEVAARRVQAHTTFLADDLLEGRGTGTRGYDLAAHYVATQLARVGVQPAGDNGTFLQSLRLRETTDDLEAGEFAIRGSGQEETLEPVQQVLVRAPAGSETGAVAAPAVFVGYAVHAPELGHDDFAGLDLEGKIAVVLTNAPARFPATQRAHYSNGTVKTTELVQRGAVGLVTIVQPSDEARYPWAFYIAQGRFPRMRLLDANGAIVDGFPELRATATVSRAAAERLFGPAGRSAADIFAAAENGELQGFDLGYEIVMSGRASTRTVESMNVVGQLPGSDLSLADQPLLLTGHLDHIGIGPAVDGDSIYNGAMDNAVGIGLLLAIAEELAAQPPLRRPVLFAALTAEEKGLLGAEYLARHLPAGVRHYAANINIDMGLFMAPVRDILAWGAEHSTLGPAVTTTAEKLGFTVSPDPMPDEVVFVRSDQYAFVRTGVPALLLGTGQRSEDPSVDLAAEWMSFLRQRYHKPSDDLSQPIDWPSVGGFAEFSLALTRAIADDPRPPAWNDNDFFGERFGTQKPR